MIGAAGDDGLEHLKRALPLSHSELTLTGPRVVVRERLQLGRNSANIEQNVSKHSLLLIRSDERSL